jgi:hypothetical protein
MQTSSSGTCLEGKYYFKPRLVEQFLTDMGYLGIPVQLRQRDVEFSSLDRFPNPVNRKKIHMILGRTLNRYGPCNAVNKCNSTCFEAYKLCKLYILLSPFAYR